MPELPDVETFRRYIDATALHREIRAVESVDVAMVTDTSVSTLRRAVRGRSFTETSRHGKWCFARLADENRRGARWLALHFGMTGYLTAWHGRDGSTGSERDFYEPFITS